MNGCHNPLSNYVANLVMTMSLLLNYLFYSYVFKFKNKGYNFDYSDKISPQS